MGDGCARVSVRVTALFCTADTILNFVLLIIEHRWWLSCSSCNSNNSRGKFCNMLYAALSFIITLYKNKDKVES